jgi:SNF2 family DNA or RNA helicase
MDKMIIFIDYFPDLHSAIIKAEELNSSAWRSLCAIAQDDVPSSYIRAGSLYMPWNAFLAFRTSFASVAIKMHNATFQISERASDRLKNIQDISYQTNISKNGIPYPVLIKKLQEVGFTRKLTPEQLRNVSKLAAFSAGASFSVPGAGKTTEALAYFFFHAKPEDKLLVVAPKNAFTAWDEQLTCCVKTQDSFIRLRSGESNIQSLLNQNPRFSIITYGQLPRVQNTINSFLSRNKVFMFLDESHRIKRGAGGVIAEVILKTSFLPYRKLVLSGTPMPQSVKDLEPQFSFLYPDVALRDDSDISGLIQPIYVRTTKAEIGLPSPVRKTILLSLAPKQQMFYQMLKSETQRVIYDIPRKDRNRMRKIGKSIIKLMQFVSNPALLAKDITHSFSEELCSLLATDVSVKVDYACKKARVLAKERQKTIIWTSFVENVELIAFRLSDIGADYIHGGVDAGDEDDLDTREGKIKRFHQDPSAMVLVANPAAASEGISLHTVCHHAIYVDRSFNAAQYLQSEDRIHRLGLPKDIETTIEILECKDTIDSLITSRLNEKVQRMSTVLNDPSLNILADIDTDEDEIMGMDDGDMEALLSYFGGGAYE